MFDYIRFFLFMVVGLSLWQLVFTSFTPLEIISLSILTTFFKWVYEITWERKLQNDD
ncbi:hypothetical protein [Halobacillus salinus]|uniref:hypothetical protein n=1 Tax=Halobacillus salinus TaxID=192814 RepID=UPI0015912845|nr:hypothetical protein [Halobacillus salinus]